MQNALIMFAVIAAFGMAAATVVILIVNEAHAVGTRPLCSHTPGDCREGHPVITPPGKP